MSNELAVVDPKELYRISTDVAGLCKEAVVKTSLKISGKNYVKVEGWQTIGAAHGCLAEIESVEEAEIEGVRGLICWSRLKRISDQAVISRASAFLGNDESQEGISGKKYARYAKVQTRAMSRVLSNAFRFVVVLMNAGLETTPAEEIPREGFGKSENTVSEVVTPPVEEQVLEGTISEIYVNKEWTYATVKGIEFSTKRDELRAQLAKIEEGALVRVTVKKMIVEGGKVKFRPVTIEVLTSPTKSETEVDGEQE
jgi:hypothetical protein